MTLKKKIQTFLSGYTSAFDFTGSKVKYPDISSPAERDAKAIASDWQAVGDDIRSVMGVAAHG